ncbi:hypothetical protein Pan258_15000 [Symmachiella dynata]|nr:hypothetical protein Pan258_15000 [Symmachiella dynata]
MSCEGTGVRAARGRLPEFGTLNVSYETGSKLSENLAGGKTVGYRAEHEACGEWGLCVGFAAGGQLPNPPQHRYTQIVLT